MNSKKFSQRETDKMLAWLDDPDEEVWVPSAASNTANKGESSVVAAPGQPSKAPVQQKKHVDPSPPKLAPSISVDPKPSSQVSNRSEELDKDVLQQQEQIVRLEICLEASNGFSEVAIFAHQSILSASITAVVRKPPTPQDVYEKNRKMISTDIIKELYEANGQLKSQLREMTLYCVQSQQQAQGMAQLTSKRKR